MSDPLPAPFAGTEAATAATGLPDEGELRLTALDEFPWHQAMTPFPLPATSDTRFNDGYYFGFFTENRFAYFGMRLYPNTNVMDGYGGMVVDGEQRTVRASRALRPNVDELQVGPMRLTVLEPMVRQRIELLDNPTGVTFDVVFEARAPVVFESPDIHYRRGRLLNHVLRYTQLCRATGTITVDGREERVDRWYADRDHSWGIRQSMGPKIRMKGVEPSVGDPRAIRIWMPIELDDHTGFFSLHDDGQGNRLDFDGMLRRDDGTMLELVDARHDFRYVPGTRRLTDGGFTLVDEHGGEHEYRFDVVCDPSSPQGYGYVSGWADGDQPGCWRGVDHLEHDRFRVDDPHTVAGPPHVAPERRLGACEYPVRLVGPGGAEGMAQIEHMVYRPYAPYGLK
ncbi:MAG: hypothetical protein M0P31_17535 [Solirubrobacteraceae bacterium]|nr:hypothetical protein [Solirubrobacteraceae bacterium]